MLLFKNAWMSKSIVNSVREHESSLSFFLLINNNNRQTISFFFYSIYIYMNTLFTNLFNNKITCFKNFYFVNRQCLHRYYHCSYLLFRLKVDKMQVLDWEQY